MPVTTIVAIAFTFLCALLCSWAILNPFFEPISADAENADREFDRQEVVSELRFKKSAAINSIDELEQDLQTGKITQADYDLYRREITLEAANCLAEIERVNGDK